jgi:hypothetical protein
MADVGRCAWHVERGSASGASWGTGRRAGCAAASDALGGVLRQAHQVALVDDLFVHLEAAGAAKVDGDARAGGESRR